MTYHRNNRENIALEPYRKHCRLYGNHRNELDVDYYQSSKKQPMIEVTFLVKQCLLARYSDVIERFTNVASSIPSNISQRLVLSSPEPLSSS